MEEKKFEAKKLIGYILIAGLMTWMFYMNKPTEAEIAAEKAKAEQVEAAKEDKEFANDDTAVVEVVKPVNDSLANIELQNKLGKFAYSASLPSAVDASTTVSNKVLELSFNNKGGYLNEAKLKDYKTHDGKPVYLVKNNNASLNMVLSTTDNRILNTKDLFFTPTITKNGDNQVVSMKLQASPTQFLEYRYEIKENDYLIDFTIRSQGLASVINTSNPINLDWKLKAFPNEKALSYENQNTAIHYLEDGDMECLGMQENDDVVQEATWVSFKQHFFSSILIADNGFKKLDLKQENYVERDTKEAEFLKGFEAQMPLTIAGGEINENLAWYYGPNDYSILESYEGLDLEENINLGWGIFGFLNKYLFIPIFSLLSGFIGSYGLIIILMTIVVRLIMSPLVYKSYMSSAKMKVIRPELQKVNEKYPDKKDAMKRQQETMRIQRESGVSMMSGCIPAVLQMPIFFALFKFFPKEIGLRQKNFLWAEDLSAYDSVYKLPFDIPFYGDHVSLFPILASIAIFFYMRMSQAQQANMQAPVQEGMPDMQKMMKYMLYFSPLMMLVFFNNYASGLSLYYFVSNLLTIGIMLAIKKFLIDEEKVLAKIKAHQKKPKKQNKFQKKMQEMMEQAEQQQKANKKK